MSAIAQDSRTDGFVLIAVLGVMALLSALVVGMLLVSRSNVDSAAIARAKLQTDALVQAGISLAAYELLIQGLPAARVNGQQLVTSEGRLQLSVSSEAGKVDLNAAGPKLLGVLYQSSGLTNLEPEVFAARVMDWRDQDDETSEGGAETTDYLAAGLTSGPRNGPFRSVNDLRWVFGLSSDDVKALAVFATIYNPRGRLDVFSAPPALIGGLPGVAAETLEAVIKTRSRRTPTSLAKLADLLLVQSAIIDGEVPRAYRIAIDARANSSANSKRVVVVIAKGVRDDTAYHILDWTDD